MGVTLFLPPPPCPALKLKLFLTRKRKPFAPTLALIREETIIQVAGRNEVRDNESFDERDWITMYEYFPSNERKAMYIVPDVKEAGLKHFL